MKTRTLIRLSGLILIATLLCKTLFAATVTVSTLNFTGAGSLNEALTTTNASSGPHTIEFSVTGTITATTLLPIITEDVTINAEGITIDGSFQYQIFDISSAATVVINKVTVVNALSVVGAVISNRGQLTLNEVTFANNRASDRAGAIYNQGGTILVNNSTINNNNGGNTGGGGIYNTSSGTIDVVNSTISGNFTFGLGGGIRNGGRMTLTHVTLANNSSFTTSGAGGINNLGFLTMSNNIVYNNTSGFFGTSDDINSVTVISTPNANLVGLCTGNCPSFPYSANPLLSPIADNGGVTQTMALLSTSPAIDAGTGAESVDQRIYSRDGIPDLGAYEFGASAMSSGTPIVLRLKAMLGGALEDTTDGLMRSDLQLVLPSSDPYGTGQVANSGVLLADTGSNSIVDWILIEIRSSATPSAVIYERAALIQRDGDIVDVDGSSDVSIPTTSVPTGTYYIALRHRNHLGVMATTPLNIP